MSLQITKPNGDKINGQRKGDRFGSQVKLGLTVVSIVFAAGMAWAGIGANAEKVREVSVVARENHDALIEYGRDIRYIIKTVDEGKMEQREQRIMLTTILTEVKAR